MLASNIKDMLFDVVSELQNQSICTSYFSCEHIFIRIGLRTTNCLKAVGVPIQYTSLFTRVMCYIYSSIVSATD